MKKFQIMIFGASTTHGNWDEMGGWSTRIRFYVIKKILAFPEKYHGHVFNLGVPGDNTEKLLKRMESEIKVRLFYPETIILVSVGTNDSSIIYNDKKAFITDEEFSDNQNKIAQIAKKYSQKVLFLGFTPVDEKRTNPWYDNSYLNERLKRFNDLVKSICEKNKIEFLDLFSLFNKKDFLKYIYDGLHPNSSGHEEIFKLTKSYIDKFLG
ncbi:hypothetical protein HZA76_01085 [Candidatus Roizmanbacteria bacterium]|nr:hypothetical protein [Candidatus Roizmanbacteria bacterium]